MTPAVVTPKWEPLLESRTLALSVAWYGAALRRLDVKHKLAPLGARPTKLTVRVKGKEVRL